ncbi:hypothetical protein BUALT_Bualt01G0205400 [Buddleja alternifolia]|uniref:Uncharacterized protein n=1 Tax=Buddleja alternifolia TaxID=168488 RepID=A0AAV6Y8R2_9LAMI|nr:hypothetical protein BUALT_Bualt01G0205400 [Buddleja alternifolia]
MCQNLRHNLTGLPAEPVGMGILLVLEATVKCTTTEACSGKPVTVVITDECPGCDSQSILFDLSGTSFGTMATSGAANQLRNVGIEQIQYRRVDCNFHGVSVAFRVDPGSNANYFATAIQYENGDGVGGVELKADSSSAWNPMQQSWGAVWKVDLIYHPTCSHHSQLG